MTTLWSKVCPFGHCSWELYPSKPRGERYYCKQCLKAGRDPYFDGPIDLTESDVSRSDLTA